MRSGFKSYPPREDSDSIVIITKAQDIPIESEQIGRLKATCVKRMENCDSASIISLAEKGIKKAGGNTLLITEFEKPRFWNHGRLLLNGDVFLVHDFSSPLDSTLSLSKTRFDTFGKKYMYMGFGVGPETVMTGMFPKISYYNFQERKKIESYYGIEASVWVVEAAWFSADVLYGIKRNIISIDNSIGLWWYPKTKERYLTESIGPYFHCTMNPKIGIKFWKIWLKAGPSLFLYKDYADDKNKPGVLELTKIGNVYYNFEILIKI